VSRTAVHVQFYSDSLAARARVCVALFLLAIALGPFCTFMETLGGVFKVFLS